MVGRIEIELEPDGHDPPGEPTGAGRVPRRRGRRRGLVAGVAVAGLATIAVWTGSHDGERAIAPATTVTAPTTAAAAAARTTAPAATTTTVHLVPVLAATDDTTVVVRLGTGAVHELRPAMGVSTELAVPGLDSTGPVALVVGSAWTMVRPIDAVRGYLVDAANQARPLEGGLDVATSAVLIGPAADSVWVESGDDDVMVTLYAIDGTPLRAPMRMVTGQAVLGADGTGNVVVVGPNGVYATSDAGWQQITTGRLLAIGPTTALAEECDERLACQDVVIERTRGTRRVLFERAERRLGDGVLGAVSNDGRLAALSNGAGTRLEVFDLVDGRRTTVGATARGVQARPVWSSDNRLLWFVDEEHALRWWDPATGAHAAVVGDVASFGLRPGAATDAHPGTAASS